MSFETGASERNDIARQSAQQAQRAAGTAAGIGPVQQGQASFQALQQIGQNVGTGRFFGDDFLNLLDTTAFAQANDVATQRFNEGLADISNGPGVRSGAAFDLNRSLATGFGAQMADSARQNRMTVEQLNRQQELDAFNLQTSLLQQALQPQRDLVNAQLGASGGLANAASSYYVASPGGFIGSIVGSLAGLATGGVSDGGKWAGGSDGNASLGQRVP